MTDPAPSHLSELDRLRFSEANLLVRDISHQISEVDAQRERLILERSMRLQRLAAVNADLVKQYDLTPEDRIDLDSGLIRRAAPSTTVAPPPPPAESSTAPPTTVVPLPAAEPKQSAEVARVSNASPSVPKRTRTRTRTR